MGRCSVSPCLYRHRRPRPTAFRMTRRSAGSSTSAGVRSSRQRRYNPGLATAIGLFAPLAALGLAAVVRQPATRTRDLLPRRRGLGRRLPRLGSTGPHRPAHRQRNNRPDVERGRSSSRGASGVNPRRPALTRIPGAPVIHGNGQEDNRARGAAAAAGPVKQALSVAAPLLLVAAASSSTVPFS